MAELRLKGSQTTGDRLPMVCMVCGQPAVAHKSKNFAWYPKWTVLLIFVHVIVFAIVASILTKRMRVDVPLCENHRGYFWKRTVLILLSFLFLTVLAIGGGIVVADQFPNDAGGIICIGVSGLFLVWLILAIIVGQTMIRPREITERSITLIGVCDDFVAAFKEMKAHDDFDDDFDDDSPRRRRRYRDDDDLPHPPRDDRTDIRPAEPDDRIRRGED
jgi:hypothetical protein